MEVNATYDAVPSPTLLAKIWPKARNLLVSYFILSGPYCIFTAKVIWGQYYFGYAALFLDFNGMYPLCFRGWVFSPAGIAALNEAWKFAAFCFTFMVFYSYLHVLVYGPWVH